MFYLKCIAEDKDFGTLLEFTLLRNKIAETLFRTSLVMKDIYFVSVFEKKVW